MELLKKALFSATGLGVLALVGSQALGTATGISYFNHLSEMSVEQQAKVSETNAKFASTLDNPKYKAFLNDPYFDSDEFISKGNVYKDGDKAYDAALAETTTGLKETIVNSYPLTENSFNRMKENSVNRSVLDMDTARKAILARNAEDSCKLDSNITDATAIALGKKYFCP